MPLPIGNAQCTFDTGTDYGVITPEMDVSIYGTATGDDYVCKGAGNEFAINATATSLDISFNAGSMAVIGGANFTLKRLSTVRLEANKTYYICLQINKTNQSGQKADIVAYQSEVGIRHEILYGSGNVRDLLLYVLNTSSNGVDTGSIHDNRKIVGEGTVFGGLSFQKMTATEWNALPQKPAEGVITFVKG